MDEAKRLRLEQLGYRVTDTASFLGLTAEETQRVEDTLINPPSPSRLLREICETQTNLYMLDAVYEHAPSSIGAYIPALPGCVAVGTTLHEVHALLRKAIEMHLTGMREDGV